MSPDSLGAPRFRGDGSAHAKIVLAGEHTVVHGTSAVAAPIPGLRVHARARSLASPAASPPDPPDTEPTVLTTRLLLDDRAPGRCAMPNIVAAVRATALSQHPLDAPIEVEVRSAIPPARGLGFSAACAAAVVTAVANLRSRVMDPDELYAAVQTGEQIAHGRASGIDARTVLSATPIRFTRGAVEPLRLGAALPLVIADSGTPAGTREAVDRVQAVLSADARRACRLLAQANELIATIIDDLADGRVAGVGAAFLRCHRLLADLGVSTPALDRLVDAAMGAGALGAKLTGGGLGGCVIVVADPDPEGVRRIRDRLHAAGAVWTVATVVGSES
ncbi:mevalonate kinase [Nocardia sp. NPDC051570]|uniref:mevalonate kinase n=1 Tax=Nocardia sp. NPDC051570 TaxID=3364324 RepID=UPI00378D8398